MEKTLAIAYNEKGQGIYFHNLKEAEEINWEDYPDNITTRNSNLLMFKEGEKPNQEEVSTLSDTVDKIVANNSK